MSGANSFKFVLLPPQSDTTRDWAKRLAKIVPEARVLVIGGGSGIRTHDTVSRIHAFQACAFSHSAIPPAGETRNIARWLRQTTGDVRGARGWTKAVADTMIEPDTDGRHRDRAQHRYLASISPPDAEK